MSTRFVEIPADVPIYLHQIYNLSRSEPRQKIDKLMSYFVRDYVDRGTVLRIQGAASDRALLLVSGRLQHLLEEEAETIEMVYPGHLVGEYGLLNQQIRAGTLTAIEDCELLVLHQDSFDAMARNDPNLALVFFKICMIR
jgi:CRP-like cAMP-binding protein